MAQYCRSKRCVICRPVQYACSECTDTALMEGYCAKHMPALVQRTYEHTMEKSLIRHAKITKPITEETAEQLGNITKLQGKKRRNKPRGGPCEVGGCERRGATRGMCKAHYLRERAGTDMTKPIIAKRRGATRGLSTGTSRWRYREGTERNGTSNTASSWRSTWGDLLQRQN